MNDQSSQNQIPISNLKKSTVQSTEVLYFTGGLIALPVMGGGLVLGPVDAANELSYIGPMSFDDVCNVARDAGCYYVGVNQIHTGNGPERSEFWKPTLGGSGAVAQTSDSWAGIANRAHDLLDGDYADIARYLSMSLRSAGWRLREVSRLHHEQLQWALLSSRRSGSRFSNILIFDLYLAVHSLVAELCAARDYLAQIAAIRVGTKPGVDSLARLCSWLEKATNSAAKSDPMAELLLVAVGSTDSPGWLAELGEMRNRLMHRQPLAANPDAAALLFRTIATPKGLIPTIRLSRFSKGEVVVDNEDPFVALLRFWLNFEELSRSCVPLARHPVVHPNFTTSD